MTFEIDRPFEMISAHDDATTRATANARRPNGRWTVDVEREGARGTDRDVGDVVQVGEGIGEIIGEIIEERWMAVARVRQGDGTDEREGRERDARGEEDVRDVGGDSADGEGGRGERVGGDDGGEGRRRRGEGGTPGEGSERDDEKNARGGF